MRLKELRKEKGLSQCEVAEALGVATMTISNYEQGIRTPDCDFIIKAAAFFNVSADYILSCSNMKRISRKNISKIGLSDTSIEILTQWNENKNVDNINLVNSIIENPSLFELYKDLYRHLLLINNSNQPHKSGKIKEDNKMLNKKVIVRGDRSGVFFGTLAAKEGSEVELEKCRRLWYWDGAASISQLAVDGTTNLDGCKFTVTVDSILILDAIEIIPCSDKAIESIEAVREWKR